MSKTTLLTNVFNEEYLLPFWLNHHKDMFDDIIIIDYKSTDKSMEICKTICPHCKIITTRYNYFGSVESGDEFMDIENSIEGIKIALNTTEFLFCETSIKDLFKDIKIPIACGIKVVSPYSFNNYNIKNRYDLLKNLLNDDIVYHLDRGYRFIHNCRNGNYHVGRHGTNNMYCITDKAHIIWFGYYPLNDHLLKRKLQIKQNFIESDIQKGYGVEHAYSKEEILNINNEKSGSGKSLKDINLKLYNMLHQICNQTNITTDKIDS